MATAGGGVVAAPPSLSWDSRSAARLVTWEAAHAVFHALLREAQGRVNGGKALLTAHGKPTVRWNLSVDRTQIVRSFLEACGKASKKCLGCGATFVKFKNEPGLDQGGPTQELFTLFRRRLLAPPAGDLCLFAGLVGEGGDGAGAEDERAFVPRADDSSEIMLDKFRLLGKALFVVVRNDMMLDSRFASYVFWYICAPDDAWQLADKAAIGTAGATDSSDDEVLA